MAGNRTRSLAMNYLRTLWRPAVYSVVIPKFRPNAAAFSSSAASEESSKTDTPTQGEVELTSTYEPDKLYKRLELEMRGLDEAVLRSYTWFCTTAASHLGIEVGKSWSLRKAEKERFTLLKSVHIYKKHKVQYEIRTYFRFLHLHRLTGSTCDTYLEYIERNLPEGCALKVTRVELMELPKHLKEKPNFDE